MTFKFLSSEKEFASRSLIRFLEMSLQYKIKVYEDKYDLNRT